MNASVQVDLGRIALKHGAGSRAMRSLIQRVFVAGAEPSEPGWVGLREMDDGAAIPLGDGYLVLTTDHGHVDAGGHGSDSAVERASFVAATRFGKSMDHWPDTLAPEELVPLLLRCRQG